MRACHHVAGRLLAIALAAALGLLARPAVALPRPTPDAVQAAALTPALRRCLLRLDARLVDGSSPAALAEAAGGRLWSAVHSRTVPLAVVFPRTATAVGRAVRCAKRAGVKVTARSGGGSFLGYSVRPGTLTLDLSELDGVTVAQNRRSVRVQGGARLGQLYYHVYKQAGPGVAAVAGTCPNVGVGGHILGGGYGFLTPWHGLACDQLLSVTMVDANGDLVTASRGKNADLFAASCGGGGGNFGIATEFRLRLHQAPALFSLATFKIAAAHAVDFLVHWQSRLLPSASSKLLFELHLQPDGTVSVVAFLPGRRAALDEELARLGVLQSPWLPGAQLPKGSTSELSWIEAMVVTAGSKARNSSLQALLDFDYMVGRRPAGFAEKSWFALKPLPRRAFPAIFAVLRKTDATVTVLSTGLKTAVRRRRQRDTAFPWRRALYFMKAAKRPAYINYIDDQASPDPLWSYYGPNLGWLRQVKAKFDPDGFFNTNPVAIPAAATNRQQPATAPQ